MVKKLEKNGMWESSRFMLPQHVDQSIKQMKSWDKRKRPILDAQEEDRILQEIGSALRAKSQITLTIFGEYEGRTVTGIPINYNQQRRTLKIEVDGDPEWLQFDDITNASGSDSWG